MDKIETFIEKWLPLTIALMAAVVWRQGGDEWGALIKAPREIVYQTMLMFSTIVVALMATFKAIIFTADSNSGITLIRTNIDMHRRFIFYIFICILMNLAFSLFSFVLMIVAHCIDGSWLSVALIFVAIYSVISLLQVIILFQIIVNPRS